MTDPMADATIEAYAAELLEAYDAGHQIAPISARDHSFDAEAAYRDAFDQSDEHSGYYIVSDDEAKRLK